MNPSPSFIANLIDLFCHFPCPSPPHAWEHFKTNHRQHIISPIIFQCASLTQITLEKNITTEPSLFSDF